MEKQLPKNWVECNLMDVSNVIKGKKDANHSTEEGEYTFFTCAFEPIRSPDYDFEDEVLILPGNGANVGHVFYFNGKFQAYQRTYIVEKIKINPKYLFYHFLAFWRIRNENEQFGTATNYIKIGNFQSYNVDVAPLAEQNRIVEKLDRLFAQLATIKNSMANIPLLLKDFRQQLLTQAVTGKLTEERRKGKELEEWQECPLSDFSEARLGKMLDNAKNSGELVSYLGNINVRWSEIDFSDLKQMKVESKELHKYELLKGDILVCEGGEPGRAAIWKSNRSDVIFQKALHRIRLNENVLPDFFLYNLKIDSQNNKLEQLFTGTTIKHLTGRSFSTYTMLVPQLEEQQEIVSRVESLFTKADAIEQQYKTLKVKIDTLPQALLHKAFKGELSEQLDSDGDAKELLEEIKALKTATGKIIKSKTNKRATKKVKPYSETEEVMGMVAEEQYKK